MRTMVEYRSPARRAPPHRPHQTLPYHIPHHTLLIRPYHLPQPYSPYQRFLDRVNACVCFQKLVDIVIDVCVCFQKLLDRVNACVFAESLG